MKRRLLTILSALSLLLFVAVCVLWVRSHFVADTIMWRRVRVHPTEVQFEDWLVRSIDGYLIAVDVSSPALPRSRMVPPMTDALVREAGFYHWRSSPEKHSRWRDYVSYRFPLWLLLPACAVMPALQLHGYRRAVRARRRNICPSCGYDLRATPGRCPECGREPTA